MNTPIDTQSKGGAAISGDESHRQQQIVSLEAARNELGCLYVVDAANMDNLAIMIAEYLETHPSRPEGDPADSEHGYGKWVKDRTDEALDNIMKWADQR